MAFDFKSMLPPVEEEETGGFDFSAMMPSAEEEKAVGVEEVKATEEEVQATSGESLVSGIPLIGLSGVGATATEEEIKPVSDESLVSGVPLVGLSGVGAGLGPLAPKAKSPEAIALEELLTTYAQKELNYPEGFRANVDEVRPGEFVTGIPVATGSLWTKGIKPSETIDAGADLIPGFAAMFPEVTITSPEEYYTPVEVEHGEGFGSRIFTPEGQAMLEPYFSPIDVATVTAAIPARLSYVMYRSLGRAAARGIVSSMVGTFGDMVYSYPTEMFAAVDPEHAWGFNMFMGVVLGMSIEAMTEEALLKAARGFIAKVSASGVFAKNAPEAVDFARAAQAALREAKNPVRGMNFGHLTETTRPTLQKDFIRKADSILDGPPTIKPENVGIETAENTNILNDIANKFDGYGDEIINMFKDPFTLGENASGIFALAPAFAAKFTARILRTGGSYVDLVDDVARMVLKEGLPETNIVKTKLDLAGTVVRGQNLNEIIGKHTEAFERMTREAYTLAYVEAIRSNPSLANNLPHDISRVVVKHPTGWTTATWSMGDDSMLTETFSSAITGNKRIDITYSDDYARYLYQGEGRYRAFDAPLDPGTLGAKIKGVGPGREVLTAQDVRESGGRFYDKEGREIPAPQQVATFTGEEVEKLDVPDLLSKDKPNVIDLDDNRIDDVSNATGYDHDPVTGRLLMENEKLVPKSARKKNKVVEITENDDPNLLALIWEGKFDRLEKPWTTDGNNPLSGLRADEVISLRAADQTIVEVQVKSDPITTTNPKTGEKLLSVDVAALRFYDPYTTGRRQYNKDLLPGIGSEQVGEGNIRYVRDAANYKVGRLHSIPSMVISGMQDGADMAGVQAAKEVGIDVSGYAAPRFMTSSGPKPEHAELYGAMVMPDVSEGTQPILDIRKKWTAGVSSSHRGYEPRDPTQVELFSKDRSKYWERGPVSGAVQDIPSPSGKVFTGFEDSGTTVASEPWAPPKYKVSVSKSGYLQGQVGRAYAARTAANVHISDATIIFASARSTGTNATIKHAINIGRPFMVVHPDDPRAAIQVRNFLNAHDPDILNIAGNRPFRKTESGKVVRQLDPDVIKAHLKLAFSEEGELKTAIKTLKSASPEVATEKVIDKKAYWIDIGAGPGPKNVLVEYADGTKDVITYKRWKELESKGLASKEAPPGDVEIEQIKAVQDDIQTLLNKAKDEGGLTGRDALELAQLKKQLNDMSTKLHGGFGMAPPELKYVKAGAVLVRNLLKRGITERADILAHMEDLLSPAVRPFIDDMIARALKGSYVSEEIAEILETQISISKKADELRVTNKDWSAALPHNEHAIQAAMFADFKWSWNKMEGLQKFVGSNQQVTKSDIEMAERLQAWMNQGVKEMGYGPSMYNLDNLSDLQSMSEFVHNSFLMGDITSLNLLKNTMFGRSKTGLFNGAIPADRSRAILGVLEGQKVQLSEFEHGIAKMIRNFYARMGRVLQEHGMLNELVENYVTHIWLKEPKVANKIIATLHKQGINIADANPFMLHRRIATIALGELKGMEPLTDIGAILGQYYRSMMHVKASKWLKGMFAMAEVETKHGVMPLAIPAEMGRQTEDFVPISNFLGGLPVPDFFKQQILTTFRRAGTTVEIPFGKNYLKKYGEKLFKDELYVHNSARKFIESFVKIDDVLRQQGAYNTARRGLLATSRLAREFIMLQPLIHLTNGIFNFVAMWGMRPYKSNPVRLFWRGYKMEKEPERLADAMRAGLNIEGSWRASIDIYESIDKMMEIVYNIKPHENPRKVGMLAKVPVVNRTINMMNRGRGQYQKFQHFMLWNNIKRMQLAAYEEKVEILTRKQNPSGSALMRGYTGKKLGIDPITGRKKYLSQAEIKKIASGEVNTRFGMLPEHWKTLNARIGTSMLLFAKNWTPSNITQAFRAMPEPMRNAILPEHSMFRTDSLSPESMAQSYREYLKFFVVGGLFAYTVNNIAQYAKTGTFMYQNEPGRKMDLWTGKETTTGAPSYMVPLFGRTYTDLWAMSTEALQFKTTRFRHKINPILRLTAEVLLDRDLYTGRPIRHKGATIPQNVFRHMVHMGGGISPTGLIASATGTDPRSGRILTAEERIIPLIGGWYRTGLRWHDSAWISLPANVKLEFLKSLTPAQKRGFKEMAADGVFYNDNTREDMDIASLLEPFVYRTDYKREVFRKAVNNINGRIQLNEIKLHDRPGDQKLLDEKLKLRIEHGALYQTSYERHGLAYMNPAAAIKAQRYGIVQQKRLRP